MPENAFHFLAVKLTVPGQQTASHPLQLAIQKGRSQAMRKRRSEGCRGTVTSSKPSLAMHSCP